jgi:FkbM family methyltransferase
MSLSLSPILWAIQRTKRVALRFLLSGQISSSPIPLIKKALAGSKFVFFVQVGANDGQSGDPLRSLILANPRWSGLFIEPVGYAFSKLKSNYGSEPRFAFEQIAVSQQAGERDFYYVSEAALNDPLMIPNSDKLGSFNREHILRHSSALEKYLICERITCEPLEQIFHRRKIAHIDLIHIDVEGYDYKVLDQINFERRRPKVVLFEHSHLDAEEYAMALAKLRKYGYQMINCGLDTLAIDKERSPLRKAIGELVQW